MIYLVNQYAVGPGDPGATRHFELSRHLVAQGESVTIIAADLNLSTRSYLRRGSETVRHALHEELEGVKFEWLYTSRYTTNDLRRALSMLRFSWAAFWRLCRAPTDAKTVFIGSSPHLPGALATRLAGIIRRVPFILEVRDLWPETLIDMTGRAGLQAKLLRLVAGYLYRTSQKIIVLTRGSRDHLAKLGVNPQKIELIPNAASLEFFEGAPTKPPMPLPSNKKLLLYAGAHGPANGLDVLIRSARELQDAGVEGLAILLVGDGPSKPELIALAESLAVMNVAFHDPIAKEAIPRLMANVHAGILTLQDAPVFRYGISPNKLFDYMAAGLPVVTNVQGEVAEIIAAARCGVIARPSDPAALADAIQSVLETLETDPAMGERGRAYAAEHHDRRKLAGRLQQVVEEARARHPRRGHGPHRA